MVKTKLRSKKLFRNKVGTRFSFQAVRFLTLFLALFLARFWSKARKKARKEPQSGALGPDHQNKAETRLKQGKNKVIFRMIFVAPVNKA